MHKTNKGFLRAFLMVFPCLLIVFTFVFWGNKLNGWWTVGIFGLFIISHAMMLFKGCEEGEEETKPEDGAKKEEDKSRSCCHKNH